MTTFNQWRASVSKKAHPRQITWVCGEERVHVDDVVEHVKKQLRADPWNSVRLVAGEDSERAIWNAANQVPLGPGYRLVVIRNAEKLERWDRFAEWLATRTQNPRTYLVMISNEERIPRTEPTPEERRAGGKPEIVPHLAAIGARGYVIECRPYTSATAKHSLEWVRSKVPMREGVARHLLERSNFDLRLVRDVCVKLAVIPRGREITISMVNDMLAEQPRDTFADALLSMDKKTALLALRDIQPEDYGRVIGLLDSRLDLAGLIYDMQSDHRAPHEIARAAGAQSWLVPQVSSVAKHYNATRRLNIRRTLSAVDQAYRGGNKIGLLELVIAAW